MNEILIDAKVKLWSACKLGDSDLLSSVMDTLLKEVEKSMELEKQSKEDTSVEANLIINMDDITKLINDGNEDGNTMLHLAALSGHLKLVWYVNIIYLIKTFPSLNCTQSITREEFYFRQLLEIGSIHVIKIRNCKHRTRLQLIRRLGILLGGLWAPILTNSITLRYLFLILRYL